MPVKVKCTNCDKVLSAPDAARGKAIKCPECQTRIAVPAETSSAKSSSKPGSAKSKTKKAAGPVDSETALATFDMRRAEDTEARICSKCGYDMKYQDEEDTECPQCGYDSEAGGMGLKARKRAMKGPDPADFYPGLFKQSWKFVGKNSFLAFRTIIYTLVCLGIALGCGFLYLWISAWPPRWFMALCFTISFLVIPGWMWFLDTEVIKLTLERKDKFKKLNFDFFLASAMGAAFVFWSIAVALPLMALPVGLGYYLVKYNGAPDYVLPLCIAVGSIPAIWMLPVVMSHMSMAVQYQGWLIWKVVPLWAKNLKPLSVWFLFFIATNILNISGITVIAAVYGSDIRTIAQTMEFNAEQRRKTQAQITNPNTQKKGQKAPEPVKIEELRDVNFKPLIVPGVILLVMTIANGFTCMFNMRTNAQFTYYFRGSLDLVDRLKEYKYKAKESREKDEDKQKTAAQHFVDAVVTVAVFALFGLVGGMLYGGLTEAGVPKGLLIGSTIGMGLSVIVVAILNIKYAFEESGKWGTISLLLYPFGFIAFVFQNWTEHQAEFYKLVLAIVPFSVLLAIGLAQGLLTFSNNSGGASQAAPAMQMPPQGVGMQPGMGAQQGGDPAQAQPPSK